MSCPLAQWCSRSSFVSLAFHDGNKARLFGYCPWYVSISRLRFTWHRHLRGFLAGLCCSRHMSPPRPCYPRTHQSQLSQGRGRQFKCHSVFLHELDQVAVLDIVAKDESDSTMDELLALLVLLLCKLMTGDTVLWETQYNAHIYKQVVGLFVLTLILAAQTQATGDRAG